MPSVRGHVVLDAEDLETGVGECQFVAAPDRLGLDGESSNERIAETELPVLLKVTLTVRGSSSSQAKRASISVAGASRHMSFSSVTVSL